MAFSAWLPQLTNKGGKREHRTVVLPDYQGAGIGHVLSTKLAAHWRALGFRASSTTTHFFCFFRDGGPGIATPIGAWCGPAITHPAGTWKTPCDQSADGWIRVCGAGGIVGIREGREGVERDAWSKAQRTGVRGQRSGVRSQESGKDFRA